MKSIWGKLRDFISKDTGRANESKKMAVLIRILSIYLGIFFVFSIIFYISLGMMIPLVSSVILMLLYFGVFASSYYIPKTPLVWAFIFVTTLWGVLTMYFFGWNSGAYAFPLLLIVLYFFSNYETLSRKVFFGIGLGVAYSFFSEMFFNKTPLVALSYRELSIVRTSIMFALLVSLSLIAYLFSRETQSLEAKLDEYNKKLERKASTDALTGLNNRGKGMEFLEKLEKEAKERIFSICMCDIDHFKNVNDTYGHDIGDEVLKAVSKVILDNTKDKGYFVSRWGGEEFFIIFPDCNGDDAFVTVQNIRKQMKNMAVKVGDQEVKVTLTYGLTEYDPGKSIDENVKEADEKLYNGKESGRDRIVY